MLVGINLLREGLDLPEVSLVAILDADKEGFLRSQRSLIQTIGRAARNVNGKVIMYADKITDSMQIAIDETNRRRIKQENYNQAHHVKPQSIHKEIRDVIKVTLEVIEGDQQERTLKNMTKEEKQDMVVQLEKEMRKAAKELDFEKAASLRDVIFELKASL